MRVHTATLAGGTSNADRVFVTDHAVILLDGASAFAPVDVDPGEYAGTLGEHIANQLGHDPDQDLAAVVADAIRHTVTVLRLGAGPSPSSTVTILRTGEASADLYVLGDSPVYYGTEAAERTVTDDRLAALPIREHEQYQAALATGAGYTDRHLATLTALQAAQREHRNQPGGYWIAEVDPAAAHLAVTLTVPADQITWAVLATDGAADAVEYHRRPVWPDVAQHDDEELAALLRELHQWESVTDPDGRAQPRAKRHDDKTLAAIPTLW